jgi:hypothetical protein
MGMPEIPAQPATSFKPMGADYEDNPNLQTAPSGNVETPAVPFQPAVAPQAAVAPQTAVSLDPDQKRQRLVEIMMGQNPYASLVAKLMYESLEKQNAGPLAEYKLYAQQAKEAGQIPLSIDAYKTRQLIAGRSVSNNTINIPHGAAQIGIDPVTKQPFFFQTGPNGKIARVEGVLPKGEETTLQKLTAARDALPKDSPDRKFYDAVIAKETNQVLPANSTIVPAGETAPSITSGPAPQGSQYVRIDGVLKAIPIPEAQALNAKFAGAEAKAKGVDEDELDLVKKTSILKWLSFL